MGPELKRFVDKAEWKYAKTYKDSWPHEYVVRDKIPEAMYCQLCKHIQAEGKDEKFFQKTQRYLHEDGWSYWIMADGGWQADRTGIVNRTPTPLYYGERMRHKLLPKTSAWMRVGSSLYETGPDGRPRWAKDLKAKLEGLYTMEDEAKARPPKPPIKPDLQGSLF